MTGKEISILAGRISQEKRGSDIVIYDISKKSDLCDYIVLVTVDSRPQAIAIMDDIHVQVKEKYKEMPLSKEGLSKESQWLVLDYSDTIIHLFSEEYRTLYNMEGLWGDSPKVEM